MSRGQIERFASFKVPQLIARICASRPSLSETGSLRQDLVSSAGERSLAGEWGIDWPGTRDELSQDQQTVLRN